MSTNLQKDLRNWGVEAYECKKSGRPKIKINSDFLEKIVEIRKNDDYGSEKIHFIMKQKGFNVSQHIIQRILDEQGLTDPCLKRRGKRNYVRYQANKQLFVAL